MASNLETLQVGLRNPQNARRYTLVLNFNGIADAWEKEGVTTPADRLLMGYVAPPASEEKRKDLSTVVKAVMMGPQASCYAAGLNILGEFARRHAEEIRDYAERRLAEQRSIPKRLGRKIAGIVPVPDTTSPPSEKVSRRQALGIMSGGLLTATGIGKTIYSALNGKLGDGEAIFNSAEMITGATLMAVDGSRQVRHYNWPEIVDKINAKLAEALKIEYPGPKNSLQR